MKSLEDLTDVRNHFAFGKNWQDFAGKVDETMIEHAVADLRRMNAGQDLADLPPGNWTVWSWKILI